MLVTDDDALAEKLRILRSHGMTYLSWDRYQGHAFSYDVVDLGYNYRIDEIRSVLGLTQLRKLKANNARRQAITERYRRGFMDLRIGLPFRNAAGESAYHLFPIVLPPDVDRTKFMDCLREERIQSSIHYPAIHQFGYYAKRYPGVSLPVTEDVSKREVTLPLYPTMSDSQVDLVISAVGRAMEYTR